MTLEKTTRQQIDAMLAALGLAFCGVFGKGNDFCKMIMCQTQSTDHEHPV
jgi:hypothetical protein